MTIPNKTLIVGLGNYLFGDEGAGVQAVQLLAQGERPPHVDLLEVGNGGFHFLGPMLDADELILIDAAYRSESVGTITISQPSRLSDFPDNMAAYETGVLDLLKVIYLQEKQPSITLYLIDIDEAQPIAIELSSLIAKAVHEVTDHVRDRCSALRL